MGAGKSTMLRKFQKNDLKYDCIDLDDALAVKLRIRPERLGEWILANGFPAFRDLEKTELKKLLRHESSMVIALGGGSLNPEILKFIKADSECRLVFLDISFENCYARIKNDPTRPLAQISLTELENIFHNKRKEYLEADLILDEEQIKEIEGLHSLVHNL